MHPDTPMTSTAATMNPVAARCTAGLPNLPTVVALGPFNDRAHAEQLSAAFAKVRLCCDAQLVLLGTGAYCATVTQQTFALGTGGSVRVTWDRAADRWPHLIAAGDVVVPCPAGGSITLLDVLGMGRPVVASADPIAVRLVVPASAGLIYRSGDVAGMAGSLTRLLTNPDFCQEMGLRARQVAQRHHQQRMALQQNE